MKKYVVEITAKVIYKVECSAFSPEGAESLVRDMYDSGQLEGEGELESVTFDTEEENEGE